MDCSYDMFILPPLSIEPPNGRKTRPRPLMGVINEAPSLEKVGIDLGFMFSVDDPEMCT